ncbi:hypothetical protein PVT67_18450 [Gallaecimonas kandeliae]|uniref:hypothetical protein n=1 Tax=Gallaecimonas kandeliae TaxID=3029055 RepID=UPI0026488718|nr:hypothetical protein [Gallaecimonas kandeliae]WKE65615.1 hypothetical protein PVT67_18450 [Gallaecimonas kandeliae]
MKRIFGLAALALLGGCTATSLTTNAGSALAAAAKQNQITTYQPYELQGVDRTDLGTLTRSECVPEASGRYSPERTLDKGAVISAIKEAAYDRGANAISTPACKQDLHSGDCAARLYCEAQAYKLARAEPVSPLKKVPDQSLSLTPRAQDQFHFPKSIFTGPGASAAPSHL